MDTANYKSRGFNASQPAHIQIANTIQTMKTLKNGHDIRQWSGTARKELILGGDVDIVNTDGDIIGTAPKLALVVVSSAFRAHLEKVPDADKIKVSHSAIDQDSIRFLLDWVKSILRSSAKFGVGIPGSNIDLIKVRHTANLLEMDLYVRHFTKAYKEDLRNRIPPTSECELLERRAVGASDEMITAVGERLAYLRRRGEFNAASVAALAAFLDTHDKIRKAVNDADLRAAHTRRT